MSTLQELYNDFNKYRLEECEYALDGFVIKPILPVREQNTDKHRPSDCVAVKFIPEIKKTKVVDIIWRQGKSGEYTPVIVFEPVVLLDKTVTKCSGHNYGYLVDNQVGIGTEIEVSLAGDIIPFLYSVLDNSSKDFGSLPEDTVVEGCHLMGLVNNRAQFIASAVVLKIPNIGPSVAAVLYDTLQHNFDSLTNILQIRPEQITQSLKGKRGQKAAESFENYRRQITLVDVIKSLNFNKCGTTCAKKCAQFIAEGHADFGGIASEGYSWVYNHQSPKWLEFNTLVNVLTGYGLSMTQLMSLNTSTNKTTQVSVMLTGSPSKYVSKKEFL